MSQRELATIQFLALWEQGVPVVWMETAEADTYAGICAYNKVMDPEYGRYGSAPIHGHPFDNDVRPYPRVETLKTQQARAPSYVCYGHCREHDDDGAFSVKLRDHYDENGKPYPLDKLEMAPRT